MLGLVSIPLGALFVLGPVLYFPLVPAVHDVARNPSPRWPALAQLLAGVAALIVTALLGVWLLSRHGFGVQVGELVFPWPAVAGLVMVLLSRSAKRDVDRRVVALVIVLLSLPYAVTVGTNTNFTLSMTQAAVFWALAVVAAMSVAVHFRPRTQRVLLPTALLLVTTTLVAQIVWTADSLEGEEIYDASRAATVLGGELTLRPATAKLIQELNVLSEQYDLSGRPSVDLTGYGSGYQLALGTRPLGRPSFFGTFAGADRSAAAALAKESCEDLRSAVVLYAENNPLSVGRAAPAVGLDISSGYTSILSFHPTHGTKPIRTQTVHVLLPIDLAADRRSCLAG